jgi:aryl-alcohol dehydrogenase-like predicted oxidoreductase
MKMRFLGNTGMQVSVICLGTANFGATGIYEKTGHISQEQADYIVSHCLDSDLNFFNTAEIYSDGISEEVLGKALGSKRQQAIIITKKNPGPMGGGLSRKSIIEGCHASLKRLGTDYIDIYQLHMFDDCTPLEVTLRALDDLVRQGKVRHIGCSNFMGWQVMKALSISDQNGWERFVTHEVMYSLLSRWLEFEAIPVCRDQNVATLAFSPLHGGFLSGKYRRGLPFPEGTRFDNLDDAGPWTVDQEQLFNIVEVLDLIAEERDTDIAQIALNYLLKKPGVCSLIIGVRNYEQLEENLKAIEWEMTEEEILRLDKISKPERRYPYYVFNPVKDEAIPKN